jgi:hypothetical protein
MSRWSLIVVLGLAACQCPADEPAPVVVRSRPTPAARSTLPTISGVGALRKLPRATVSWRWAHHHPDSWRRDHRHDELELVEAGKRIDYFFSIDAQPQGVAVVAHGSKKPAADAKPLWRYGMRCDRALRGKAATLDGALSLVPLGSTTLHVACFPAAGQGYQVHALDARTGRVLWRVEPRPLLADSPDGAGPEFRQAIQLGTEERYVTVYNNNPVAPFVDALDVDGKPVGSAAPPRELTRIRWRFGGSAAAKAPDGEGGRYTYRPGPREAARVRRTDREGKTLWETGVVGRPYARRGVLLLAGPTLFVARYCPGASGADLFALAAGSGELRWKTAPYGIGTIGHSKYSNAVRLELLHDHLVVFGRESGGRYIEVIDPRTGRSVANQRFF